MINRLRLGPEGPTVTPFAENAHLTDLQLAPSGNVAYVSPLFFGPGEGTVEEIVYCPVNCAPIARAGADPRFGEAPLEVAFTGDRSSDPEDTALTFEWDFGDGSPRSALANPAHTYTADGVYTAALTVTDPGGRSDTASIPISVGNTPPSASIDAPADEATYVGGQPIELEGSGTDAEDGAVPAAELDWRVILHHGDHVHPYANLEGGAVSFTPAADHDADSYFEVELTVRDSAGLTGTTSVDLRPRTVPVTLESSPAGAPLTWVSSPVRAPFSTVSAAGFRTVVSAAATFVSDGRTYAFDRWSDGGAAHHEITIPAEGELRLVASYRDTSPPAPQSPEAPRPEAEGSGLGVDPFEPPAAGIALGRRDRIGPRLTLDATAARRGRLAGGARDPSGVSSVHVALRKPRSSGRDGCRWWLAGQRRLARRRQRCSDPRWIRAALIGRPAAVGWRARLGRALGDGPWVVQFRAVDRAGNVSRSAGARAAVRFVVDRR